MMAARRCVFFDRDGIVNIAPESRYVERWEDFSFHPGFVPVLRMVKTLGFEAVVVTNQKGIAKGIMSRETVEDIHRRFRAHLMEEGLAILDVLYCPHGDEGCACRKPNPGMLLEAARRYQLDLNESWMIGDQERDVEAGRRAGCRTILVAEGKGPTCADYRFASLSALQENLAALLASPRRQSGPAQ